MVQLKVGSAATLKIVLVFQFLNGTIKSEKRKTRFQQRFKFQFLNGTIKSRDEQFIAACQRSFNS